MAKPVGAPTLLVAGAADTLASTEHIGRLMTVWTDWTYQEMDGVGHNPQMQAPGRFLSVLFEWLAARDGTPV